MERLTTVPPVDSGRRMLSAVPAWARCLAVGGLGIVGFLSASRNAGIVVFAVVMAAGAVAGAVGVRRSRPERPVGWWLLIAALCVSAAANTMFAVGFDLYGEGVYVSVVDIVYFVMYALLFAGLTVLVPRRARAWSAAELIDAGVVTAGMAAVWWTVVIEPYLHQAGASSAMVGVWLIYAACDLLVLSGLARLVFTTGLGPGANRLLAASIFALLAGDAVYFARVGLEGYISVSNVDNGLWLTWAVLFGAGALHPSVPQLGRVARSTGDARPGRLLMFAGLAFLCPLAVVIGVQFAHRYAAATAWYDVLVPTLLGAVITGLLVVRLGLLARVAQRRAALLDRQAAELKQALRDQDMLQRQLTHRALHDPLTGLANQALLLERLERALARTSAAGAPALLLIGLAGFADVNDTLGHTAGDEVLVEVSHRLLGLLTGSDSLARVGPDEFALLLEAPPDPALVAAQVVASTAAPYVAGGREVVLSARVGYRIMEGPLTAAEVLRDAGVALRAATAGGRARIVAFEAGLRSARLDTAQMVADLRRAVAGGELRLHYQPVVDSRTGAVRSLEALLRWTRPDGRPVPPDEFIPVAEESGLILAIGAWVLHQAIAQAVGWHRRYGVSIAVNVSGHQLSESGFDDMVLGALHSGGLPPTALILEITETALVAVTGPAAPEVRARLQRLREHGIRIAIDDFGTGYASLSYLRHLPVDILKIDRSFVGTGESNQPSAQDRAFIRAILHLSQNLELTTIAEGVETPQQAALLQHMECNLAQGFLFHRPAPAEAVTRILAEAPEADPATAVLHRAWRAAA